MFKKAFIFLLVLSFLQAKGQDNLYDTDLLSKEFHKLRRQALREIMQPNSVAVFFSSPERNRSNDVNYLYHQDPDFYYLCGYTEPNAVLVIFKEEKPVLNVKSNEFIFVQDRNPDQELWTGRRLGKDGVKKQLGIEGAFLNSDFKNADLNLQSFTQVLVGLMPKGAVNEKEDSSDLYDLIEQFKEKSKLGNTNNLKLFSIMAKLRQHKQPEELKLLRKAITATCNSLKELMRAIDPSMSEYQAQAIIEYGFKKEGSEYPGFPSIVGAGENSCILHYETSRKKFVNKDLLVADVGAEYHGYSADVTRTIPVNGKFTDEQKIIYNIVLEAQAAGIRECKKGNSFNDPGIAATKVVIQGLMKNGIIKTEEDYRKYFPHGTSHYLGLDVHDAGMYGELMAGDLLTVEPGIYIPAGSDCDPKWWNIGVRIEDDILVTETGYENLSEAAPRKVDEIEKLMAEKSFFNAVPADKQTKGKK